MLRVRKQIGTLTVMLLVLLVLVGTAVANGIPTIVSNTPSDGSVVTTSDVLVSFTVTDSIETIQNANYYLKIDGNQTAANFQYKGHYVNDVYVIDSYNEATISTSLTGLSDGTHTVDVQAMNSLGDVVTKTWQFSVAVAPILSNQTPTPQSDITTANTQIGVNVTYGRNIYAVSGATFSIDGGLALTPVISGTSPSYQLSYAANGLKDGSHTVILTIPNIYDPANPFITSTPFTAAWSFTVKAPPAITKVSPTYTVTKNTPALSAYATDNTGLSSATFALDGTSINGLIDTYYGRLTATPSSPLADGNHTVVLTVSDAAGNQATSQWQFNVDTNLGPTYPSLPVSSNATCWTCHPKQFTFTAGTQNLGGSHPLPFQCTGCHASSFASRAKFRDCNACHFGNFFTSASHPAISSQLTRNLPNRQHAIQDNHLSSTVDCIQCHSRILTQEHNKLDKNGNQITCDTCHAGSNLSQEISTGGSLRFDAATTNWAYGYHYLTWYTPAGVTVSRIYLDMNSNLNLAEISGQFDTPTGKQWARLNLTSSNIGSGAASYWIDLPFPAYGIQLKIMANTTNSGYIDVPKAMASVDKTNPDYIRVQTAITNKDTNCESCHTARHQHTVAANGYAAAPNVDCSKCHATGANGTADLVTIHQDAANTGKIANFSCATCHNSTFEGADKVIVKDGSIDMKKNGTTVINCTDCHNGTSADSPGTKYPAHNGNHINSTGYGTYAGTYNGQAFDDSSVNCSKCHANLDTKAVHDTAVYPNVSCNSCHQSTNTAVQAVINGAWSRAATKTPYTCATCHNTLPYLHNPEHTATSADAATVNCAGCHTGTSWLNNNAQVVGVHNNNCNTCHNSANDTVNSFISGKQGTANTVYACEGCHTTGGAKTKEASHTPFHNADTLKYPDTAGCLGCHAKDATTDGQSLLGVHMKDSASTVTCDTCHGSAARQSIKDAIAAKNVSCQACHGSGTGHVHPVAADGYAAAPNVDCSKCHATGANGIADLTAIHQDAANAGKIANYSCATCHNSTFEGADKVIVKDGSLDMKKNGTTVINCTDCHNGTSADSPGTKYPAHNGNHINSTGYGTYAGTYNGQAFDDSSVNCSKCHANLDTKAVHDTAVYPNVSCNSCHQSTNTAVQAVINGAWSRAATKTPYTCATCHNTLPYLHNPEHTATSADAATINCAGCHTGTSWLNNNAQVVGVHNNNCNTCHNSANATVNSFISGKQGTANTVYACEGCHTTGGANTKEAIHQPEHTAKHSAANMDCSGCHGFSAAAGVATDIKSTAIHKDCNMCHGSAVRSDVKTLIAGKTGQSNPVYNCEDCHGALHVGWDAKHKPTFPTNTVDCASCHNNYLPAEHTKYFANSSTGIGYSVFRSTSSSGPWTAIGSTTATGYADTGLSGNTTYYYKVQAYDGKPNYSGFSNTISVNTLSASPVTTTVNPDSARYASGNNGDSSSDPSSTTNVLTQLTDNSNSTYSTVQENGSSDQYVFVNLNKDAKDYTKVELKMSVRYYNSTNLTIYPYSTSTSVNTNSAYTVDGPNRSSSSSFITETIDVTKVAQAMNGFGWMKFRIKPDPAYSSKSVYIANVQIILTQNPVSGGTTANPPGTVPSQPSDTSTPTAPSGLSGAANYYDRIDLAWTASTDTASESDTCALCHGSNVRQQAKDAVAAKNANCSACHTIHSDTTTAHTGPALPTTPWDCAKCHTNVLSTEHSANATLQQNAALDCNTCHKSTLPKVTAAINSTVTDGSNRACGICHTGTSDGAPAVHSDITAPHLTGIFPTAQDPTCLNCHPTIATAFSSTKESYHAVNGLTPKTSGKGGYINGWTATSPMNCKNCHGSNGTSPTSAYANILIKPFSAQTSSQTSNDLCFLCHDRANYGGGSSNSSGFKNSSGSNLHNNGNHRIACVSCHTYAPHGGKWRLLGTTSDKDAPFSSNAKLIRVDRVTSYSVSNCATNCGEHPSY